MEKQRIVITSVDSVAKRDELAVTVGFKLFPSAASFSMLMLDLHFDVQKLRKSALIAVPKVPLVNDDFELTTVLDMRGIVTHVRLN